MNAPSGKNTTKTYQLQRGDTLSAVARRNGTTVPALAEANGIADPNRVDAGQTLVIPSEQVAPAGAAEAAKAGKEAASDKADSKPGEVVKPCEKAKKKEELAKVRAGGDDNVDVFYAEAGGSAKDGVAQGQVGAGMTRMNHAGHFGDNSIFGGSHQLETFTADAKGHAGADGGAGLKGAAGARMVKEGGTLFVGTDANNPYAEAGGEYELFSSELKGDALLGSDGKRVGVALGGAASASAAKGDLMGEINIPIPFTNWTLSLKGKGGVSAGALGAGARGYGYKNLETGRFHLGAGGEAAALLGAKADFDLSLGPSYTSRDRPDGP